MLQLTLEPGPDFWTTLLDTFGVTPEYFRTLPYFSVPAAPICAGRVSRSLGWIKADGTVLWLRDYAYHSVALIGTADEIRTECNKVRAYDRDMAPDPETGRRRGLYS